MCDSRNSVRICLKGRIIRVDRCISDEIIELNENGTVTVGSCCGHGKYKKTIVVSMPKLPTFGLEMFSDMPIPRKRRFYKKDENTYYYIPEVI